MGLPAERIGHTLLTLIVLFSVVATTPAAAVSVGASTTADADALATVSTATQTVLATNTTNVTNTTESTNTSTNATTLTILTYNDIQTAVADPTQMGRLVGLVNDRRQAHENPTVVVGGGDQVSPSSLAPLSQWRVPVKVLNVLDPAAEVVGNHDLDYGFDAVNNYSAASEFPWLVANVVQEDGSPIPGTKNYTIVERNGVKIGVVGLVDEAMKPKTAVDFEEHGYRVADFSDVGSRIATKLKEEKNVDVVVAAAHIGVPESKELARETENIDLIVTGDDEVTYSPQTTSGTVIVEAKARAEYVGEVNLTVTDSGVSLASGRLIPVDENVSVNATAKRIVAESRDEQLDEVIGRTNVPLDSTFDSNYADETAWGNLITDAFRNETGAEVAVTNAGGIRGNFVIDRGNLSYGEVYTSLPFGNYLVTKRMTGEQLEEFLASQVTSTSAEYGAQAQLQVSGVSYEFATDPNATDVVRDVDVNGEPLRPNATYNVTVNSYMAGFMGDLPTVDIDYTLYGTVVADYVAATSPVAPEDTNRIQRVDTYLDTDRVVNPPTHAEKQTVSVRVAVPDHVDSVNASTAVLQNATAGSVAAESAVVRDGKLVVTFDQDTFRRMSDTSTDLDVYVRYGGDSAQTYLNVDVTVPSGQTEAHPGNGPEKEPNDTNGNGAAALAGSPVVAS